jgi:endonuclease G
VLSLQKGKEKAIGFVMNNSNDDQPMKDAAMSVDDVEKLTGFDFFASLPDNLEKRVESNYSLKAWH